MSQNPQHDVLTRISQYVAYKNRSDNIATNCQMGIIQTVLFNAGNKGLTISEIIQEIEKTMGLKNFPYTVIENALENNKEEVYVRDEKYFLVEQVFDKLKETIEKRSNALNNFELTVKKKVEEKTKGKLPKIDLERTTLQSIYEFLALWFGSETKAIAESIRDKHQIILPELPNHILEKALSNIQNPEEKKIIEEILQEVLSDITPETGELLFSMLENYLNLELLNADPECRFLEKLAFSKKTLVLDTNVLMSYFLEAHRGHEGIEETLKITKELGVNLVFTKKTENEWLNSLENANGHYNSLNKLRPSMLPYVDDAFIRTFFVRKSSDNQLTWQGFYAQMKQMRHTAYERGISYWYKKEYEIDQLPNKEFFEPLTQFVFNSSTKRGYPKPRTVSEHDAYHLLLVRKLREENPPDILGPSCWFLTLDSTLLNADDGLNRLLGAPYDPPSSFIADMWIPVISPFLGPEVSEKRLSEAFAHLMSTHFAKIPSSFNADMILITLDKWLAYDKLTNKEIEAILGDGIVAKYYDELREAKIKEPNKIEELTTQIHDRVDKKVYEMFDSKVQKVEEEREKAETEKIKAQADADLSRRQLAEKAKIIQLALKVCIILGAIFAIVGLLVAIFRDLNVGIALIAPSIIFLVVAIGFNQLKFKGGPIEFEASKSDGDK